MPIRIDVSQMPAIEKRIMSARFCERIKAFYEDPENVRRFEEWQKNRNSGAAVSKEVMV